MLDPSYETELKERLRTKWSRNAFKCHKCPGEGCPAWQSVFLDDPVNGRRTLTGCGFVLQPLYHNLTMGFSQAAADTVEQQSKDLQRAVLGAARTMQQLEAQRELKVLNSGVDRNS